MGVGVLNARRLIMKTTSNRFPFLTGIASYYTGPDGNYQDGFPPEVLALIRQEKLFKCFLPPSFGGLGLSMRETLGVIEAAAYINGSLGWLIQIGNGGNYFAAYFDEQTSKGLFGPANAVLAGSGAITGTATRVEGGFRVSGQWKYCSGSDHASFFTCSARVENTGQIISCAVLPQDVQVIHDWKTIGLKFTSTNSMKIENAFVPAKHVFNLAERKSLHDTGIYYFPFLAYAQAFFLSNVYGLFRRFIDEGTIISEQNHDRWKVNYPERYVHLSNALDDAKKLFAQSQPELLEFVHGIETTGAPMRDALVRSFDEFTRDQVNTIRVTAQTIFPLLGMDALYTTSAIGCAYTDLLCTCQHMLLNRY